MGCEENKVGQFSTTHTSYRADNFVGSISFLTSADVANAITSGVNPAWTKFLPQPAAPNNGVKLTIRRSGTESRYTWKNTGDQVTSKAVADYSAKIIAAEAARNNSGDRTAVFSEAVDHKAGIYKLSGTTFILLLKK